MRRRLWWIALAILLLHQVAQKGMGWHWGLADAYLDPFLCMPLLLGLTEWEWGRQFGKKQLRPVEVIWLTAAAALLFEWGFPSWSAAFTADVWDVVAYIAGSALYGRLQKMQAPAD